MLVADLSMEMCQSKDCGTINVAPHVIPLQLISQKQRSPSDCSNIPIAEQRAEHQGNEDEQFRRGSPVLGVLLIVRIVFFTEHAGLLDAIDRHL
jgi:hypothetical protein